MTERYLSNNFLKVGIESETLSSYRRPATALQTGGHFRLLVEDIDTDWATTNQPN